MGARGGRRLSVACVSRGSRRAALEEPISTNPDHNEVGLCETCRHARRLESAKGSVFWRCEAAAHDPRLRPYPQLPVRECPAYQSGDGAGSR